MGLGEEDPDPLGSCHCLQSIPWDWELRIPILWDLDIITSSSLGVWERRIPIFWDLGFFPGNMGKEDPDPLGSQHHVQ